MLLCVGALGCTFLDSGIGAIHRWIRLGPLALNAAFAFVPVALIGMNLLFRSGNRRGACALSLLTGVLLFLQPDASMSGAFAMAVLPALWHGDTDRALWRTVWGILTVLAVLSWAWLKSPEPVAQAEGILTLASASGTGWWLMGLLSLAALFFPFAASIRRQPARLFCEGSLLFYAGLTAASCTGLFPVPVLGSGASPILGYLISATYAVKRLNAGEG